MTNERIIYGYQSNRELIKGYYTVDFYDDDGVCKSHWLSGSQVQYFRDRKDAVKYIKEVKKWNAIRFTQTLIRKVK